MNITAPGFHANMIGRGVGNSESLGKKGAVKLLSGVNHFHNLGTFDITGVSLPEDSAKGVVKIIAKGRPQRMSCASTDALIHQLFDTL